ncbi:hypothetical protein LAWI1_G008034 [Lachnellula willkommii]|uniref:DUF6604 domain-containing protein n=1 Tax=Lachnellula willkommii TaxID=215461 RepID=A0A559M4K8_9HELO|nr:hypothetical protein LAWI1_G008034 [Lachnellula willkommii]
MLGFLDLKSFNRMLPSFLDGTYNRYKNDTSTFVRWLSENAQRCGYVTTVKTATPIPPTKTPRLKGKARKEAKKTESSKPASSSDATGTSQKSVNYSLVSLKDLLPSAIAIVDSKDPVVLVPVNIIRAGLRAVSARKRCAEYYKSQTPDNEAAKSNHSHSYFISLMEQVMKALQPRFGTTNAESATKPADLRPTQDIFEYLENRFAVLDVEEPSEQEDVGATTAVPKVSQPVYRLESFENGQDVEEEKLFAIFCLFDDLWRLREYVAELWLDYKNGELDLVTAAITTNTAFQLAIRNQKESLSAFPSLEESRSLRVVLKGHYREELADDAILKLGGIAEWSFAPVHRLLDKSCASIITGALPLAKQGLLRPYNPGADRTRMGTIQRQMEDFTLLHKLIPEFALIERLDITLFSQDELTRGLCQMVKTKEIPIWLTFATTCFLDIHHILRGSIDRTFEDLQDIGNNTKRTFDRHFAFSRGLTRASTWPQGNEDNQRKFSENVEEFILKDIIFPLKVEYYQKTNRLPPGESERFYLYKHQPILCGLLAFRTILETQYPAHFYNALQQQEKSITPWPLIEQLIAIHHEERIFLGGRPRNIQDCAKQVSLVLGYSPEQFARNRRTSKPVLSKNGPRGLKNSSVLGEFFRQGLPFDGSMEFTMSNIEELFNEQARDAELAANPQSKALRREWKTSKRLSPLQLLQSLRASLPVEIRKLRLDYFLLHEQTIQMMRALVAELDADLIKLCGPEYLGNESALPLVGAHVILAAYQTERVIDHYKISNAGSLLLEKAGKVVEDFLKKQE